MRRVPYPTWALVLAVGLMGSACRTPRYVGALTREGAFVHRGFGLVVDLEEGAPWQIVRSGDNSVPPALWPRRLDGPIDFDGDGERGPNEWATYEDPTLRLVSRTSTATRIDLRVRIAGDDVKPAQLLRVRQSADSRLTRRTVAVHYDGWIGRCDACSPEDRLVAIVDHAAFVAESGSRRQLVELTVIAPRIDDTHEVALGEVLDRLLLARRADGLTQSEARRSAGTR